MWSLNVQRVALAHFVGTHLPCGRAVAAVCRRQVLPGMLALSSKVKSKLPLLVLMAAPLEVVLGTTAFSVFRNMFESKSSAVWWVTLLSIMLAIVGAMLLGGVLGLLFDQLLTFREMNAEMLAKAGVGRASATEDLLGLVCFALAGNAVADALGLSSVLAVLAVPFVLRARRGAEPGGTCARLSANLRAVWFFGELTLFFLIGAELDVREIPKAGPSLPAILVAGMAARLVGVCLALRCSDVSLSGCLFCWVATMPKATVQAALGGQPLDAGVAADAGNYILTASVVSVGVFASLGIILTGVVERSIFGDRLPAQAGEANPAPSFEKLAIAAAIRHPPPDSLSLASGESDL